jgi:ribose transport system substrate-binding protein
MRGIRWGGERRRASLALLAAAVALVAGCGGGGSSPSGGGGSAAGAPAWCGSKSITLALADGFGDNNWRRITKAEAQAEAGKCPSVSKFQYTDGQGNTQKAISDIQGLAAQGVNATVVFPDAGQAVLPAIRSVFKQGLVVVPYRVFPGGRDGVDYSYYISTDFKQAGVLWAKWMAQALHGKGNIANLGGPPANSQSQAEYDGMQSVFKDYPDIHFVGQTPYNVTNWDPSLTQSVVAGLLAKYPQIDGFTTDFGAALVSSFGAFQQAHRAVPAVATEDANQLSCTWASMHASDPGFQLFTVDSQTWMVRTAVDFAVAKASGGQIPRSESVPQAVFEDSVTNTPRGPECNQSLPPDALLSSQLSTSALKAALG